MIGFDEALRHVAEHRWVGQPESAKTPYALGRTLSGAAKAARPSPPFDSSAMDGFAVSGLDGPWRIIGSVRAGQSFDRRIEPCQAVRIFTGAPVPPGTSCVVAQEDAVTDGICLASTSRLTDGQHVRRRAEEFDCGAVVVDAGTSVTAGVVGTLAALGLAEVTVRSVPKVAVLATGDELALPGTLASPAQAYESNTAMLMAALAAESVRPTVECVPDDLNQTIAGVAALASRSDVLITVGGVSVGDHDHVRRAFLEAGGHVIFSGVGMKPGKPVTFGVFPGGCRWIGLPGNPCSALVTYLTLATVLLGFEARQAIGRLLSTDELPKERDEFRFAVWSRTEPGALDPISSVGSHAVATMSRADVIYRFGPRLACETGRDIVEAWHMPGAFR